MDKSHVIVTSSALFGVDVEAMERALDGIATIGTFDLPRERVTGEEEDRIVAALEGADGMLVRIGTVSESLLARLPRLKVIALHGVGVDQVDVAAATEHGVWVTNVPGGNATAVVELTIGLFVSMLRRIPTADRQLRERGGWDESRFLGAELGGKTVGLVGCGNIARGVARICRAMNADVIATKRRLDESEVDGIPLVPFEELLQRADIVSLHLPLTDESRSMMNEEAFGLMKPGSYFVNVSRGPIVDQPALERALETEHLAGAALDVLHSEPPDYDSPLFAMPNVVLTPHMGGSTAEALTAIAGRAAEDIARVLRGEQPLHSVNDPLR